MGSPMTMQQNIISRLFNSFEELERAIGSARETLKKRENVSPDIIKRIESYDGILAKQRSLATSLCNHINCGNWDEVSRHVGLINGLSAMIRDDARAILSALSTNPVATESEEDINYC